MSDVYVVTSGCYSSYEINQVFKSREKAELYCDCHEGCFIEEWNFNDDNIYTTANYLKVVASIYIDSNRCDIQYAFGKFSIEDEPYKQHREDVMSYIGKEFAKFGRHVEIVVYRELPDNYSNMQIEYKWRRIIEDLAAEIRYEFSNVYHNHSEVSNLIKKMIEFKEAKDEE